MGRYLLITTLDVNRQPNNREHHLIRHVIPRFSEACVVYRKRNDAGSGHRLRQMLPGISRRTVNEAGVTFLAVDPFLNTAPNAAMNITRSYAAGTEQQGEQRGKWLFHLLDAMGVIKDLSTILSMLLTVLVRTSGRFDVAVGMGPFSNAVISLLKAVGKIDCHVYQDRDFEEGFFHSPMRRRFVSWLERRGISRADVALTIGHRLADLRRSQTGRTLPVITTGVDYSRFQMRMISATQAPRLVYVGNVTYWSGLDVIIEALARLHRVYPGAHLEIVGEGLAGYREQLNDYTRELGLEHAVSFTGRVENCEIPNYLARADIGLALFRPIPLRAYAFPLKLLEYMAAGVPVIGNRDTESADVIRKHEIGLSIGFTAQEMADACVRMLGDQARYRSYSENARAAAAEYDWPALMERDYRLITQSCRMAH